MTDNATDWNPPFLEPGAEQWTDDDYAPDEGLESAEIRQSPADIRRSVQEHWEEFLRVAVAGKFDDESLLHGVEKVYSTAQAAAFFGRTAQWIYWGLRNGIFTYKDGTPIQPRRVGRNDKRQFTLPLIREIALSHFRRGNLTEDELEQIMARILLAEFGPQAFSDTSVE